MNEKKVEVASVSDLKDGEMKEVSENDMLEAIKFAHEAIKKQIIAIKERAKKVGEKRKRVLS